MEPTNFLTFEEVEVSGHCIRPGYIPLPDGYEKETFTNAWNGESEEVVTKDGIPVVFATSNAACAKIAEWS